MSYVPRQCEETLSLFPRPNEKVTKKNHKTIGDVYMSVVYLLGQLSICGKKNIFTGKTKQLEWSDPELLREVKDYESALKAIKSIVDQGEGASAYNPLQQNMDSSELSHYFKFSSIFHGRQITTFNVTNKNVHNNNEKVNYTVQTFSIITKYSHAILPKQDTSFDNIYAPWYI